MDDLLHIPKDRPKPRPVRLSLLLGLTLLLLFAISQAGAQIMAAI
ncbi:hypothetical protein [Rhodobacter ferrooxidans]|jgi:hypothetical protein|uniref:Uncharacterized protein n=1 Tax=Rhodobacter ferrooxidans TaxID=371731 RepID=C8S2A8_9RHOB|nr:hypothetical protein [Rhodobacter sp. SW2]EEW24779.1 hypothetical protein Rsw2DRAFT_2186 [Rhodobacter sp. SW2]